MESAQRSIPQELIEVVKPESATGSVLVYSNERQTENVAGYAIQMGLDAQYLNSDIDPEIAKEIINRFNAGDIAFLITTPALADQFHLR